jgi:hypothetical protein
MGRDCVRTRNGLLSSLLAGGAGVRSLGFIDSICPPDQNGLRIPGERGGARRVTVNSDGPEYTAAAAMTRFALVVLTAELGNEVTALAAGAPDVVDVGAARVRNDPGEDGAEQGPPT